MSVTEPEFTPHERDLLIAYQIVDEQTGTHGIPMGEATDPTNQFGFIGDAIPLIDWAEKARLDAQDAYFKANDKKDAPANRNGLIFRVQKRPIETVVQHG